MSSFAARDEITNAIRDVVYGINCANVHSSDVDESLISKCLYTCHSSNPELLIRTSGEIRLSDFLMWQVRRTFYYCLLICILNNSILTSIIIIIIILIQLQTTGTYLYFAEVLWPEFSIWDLLSAIFHYQRFRANLEKISNDSLMSSVIDNNKLTSFIDKLYLERQAALENYAAVKT